MAYVVYVRVSTMNQSTDRQLEGVAIAKAKGRYKGRPKTIDRSEILTLLDDGLSMRKTAGKLGVSLSTVQWVKMENMTCFRRYE